LYSPTGSGGKGGRGGHIQRGGMTTLNCTRGSRTGATWRSEGGETQRGNLHTAPSRRGWCTRAHRLRQSSRQRESGNYFISDAVSKSVYRARDALDGSHRTSTCTHTPSHRASTSKGKKRKEKGKKKEESQHLHARSRCSAGIHFFLPLHCGCGCGLQGDTSGWAPIPFKCGPR